MTRWLGIGLALSLTTPALAADPCKAAVKELSKAPAATLVVSSERLPYTHVTLAPDERSDKDTWWQLSRFTAADGTTWDGVDELTCEGGVLYLHSFTHRTQVGDVEDFHPPLPWLRLDLAPEQEWSWTGVLTVGPPGSELRLVADASFKTGPVEELEVPAGKHSAIPVTYALEVGGGRVVTTSWVMPQSPWTLVKRTRTFYDQQGEEARTDTWELERVQ